MTQYKVLSDNLAGHAQGATISEDDLVDVNIAALLDGGHLATIGAKQQSKTDDKDK